MSNKLEVNLPATLEILKQEYKIETDIPTRKDNQDIKDWLNNNHWFTIKWSPEVWFKESALGEENEFSISMDLDINVTRKGINIVQHLYPGYNGEGESFIFTGILEGVIYKHLANNIDIDQFAQLLADDWNIPIEIVKDGMGDWLEYLIYYLKGE